MTPAAASAPQPYSVTGTVSVFVSGTVSVSVFAVGVPRGTKVRTRWHTHHVQQHHRRPRGLRPGTSPARGQHPNHGPEHPRGIRA